MAEQEMVWVYSGWSADRCPHCDGGMAESGPGHRCLSCGWPNDHAKTAPSVCELIAANNLRHCVIPGSRQRGASRLPGYEEVAPLN